MDEFSGQPKRTNIPQATQRQGCLNSPFKAGFEKRKLSLRSKNATTTSTTQTASLSSRQQTAAVPKQSGKENELPFDQDLAERNLVTFAKSESKKKKPSIPSVHADSAKRALKRRLSADYRDHQLSSNKFYRGEIELVNRPTKVRDFLQTVSSIKSHDNRPKFSVYDEGIAKEAEKGVKGLISSTNSAKQRFGFRELERRKGLAKDIDDTKKLSKRWLRRVDPVGEFHAAIKAPEAKVRNASPADDTLDKLSSAGEKPSTSKPQSLVVKALQTEDSTVDNKRISIASNFANESSDAEFRIERVDCRNGMTPAMNNLRKFKSGSSIGHLKLPVRRGDEISPLKRRFNRFKRSVMNLRSNADVKAALTTALKSSEMGSPSAEEVKELSKKRSNCTLESMIVYPSVEATNGTHFETSVDQKINRGAFYQGKKSNRRRSSEPSIMCIGTTADDTPVSEDRHELCSNGIVRGSQTGIGSQYPIVTLSTSSRVAKNDNAGQFDSKVEKIEASCEGDMMLRKKWDAVVAEFKNKFKPNFQEEKSSIQAVVSNEIVLELAPNCAPDICLQLSFASQSKDPERCETDFKMSKSAARVHIRKEIEAELDAATAIATEDEDVQICPRTTLKNSETSRRVQKRYFDTTDYEEEIISLEYARERRTHQVSKTFLKGKTVLPEQRKIVVNFLIGVHAYLSTSSSTLYQATKIFDAILDLRDVSVKELQLVALGASWIAIKNIETNIPSASDMISFAKDMYKAGGSKLLCKCEKKILKTLNFNLRFADPFYLLAHYIEQGLASGILPGEQSIRKIYHCADYIMNTALLDESYSNTSAQLLAAAAAQTAVRLTLGASEYRAKWFQWRNEKITGYAQKELEQFVAPLLVSILESAEKNSSTNAVYKKYKSSRYQNISDFLIAKIKNQPRFLEVDKKKLEEKTTAY